jgi:hypothetical protein
MPKDTQLRDIIDGIIIDGIPSETQAPVFKAFHERLKRHKYLKDCLVLTNTLMCVIYHSSKSIHCEHFCGKNIRVKSPTVTVCCKER